MGRRPSLRARVALAAALGAVVVAAAVAGVLVVLLARREVTTLDRRLATVTDVLSVRLGDAADAPLVTDAEARRLVRGLAGGLAVTVREPGSAPRTIGGGAAMTALPATDGDAFAGGRRYRVHTVALADGGTVTAGLPRTSTDAAVAGVRRDTVLVALAAALGAAGLGWLFAGRALRPMRELRDRTASLSGRPTAEERAALTGGAVRDAAESAELAEALTGLLDRVEQARAEGESALAAARDFAAAASHELRTPLTTLRTDLDVLAEHPELPAADRSAVVAELRSSSARLEVTLTALGQLAGGELRTGGPPERVDLADVAAEAVAAARRLLPERLSLQTALPDGEVPVMGAGAGLRLAVDNLVLNAVRHAGGRRIVVSVGADPGHGRAWVLVDDDGTGVPAGERARVFDRFVRGSGVTAPGSGLGLALVAQQARLHGGWAQLTDSPLGGTRAVLDLPLAWTRPR